MAATRARKTLAWLTLLGHVLHVTLINWGMYLSSPFSALELSVTEAAEALGVTRVALSRVLNGRAAISPEMALRLEKWLGPERGGDASFWLAQQAQHDLWQARKASASKLRQIKPAAAVQAGSGH